MIMVYLLLSCAVGFLHTSSCALKSSVIMFTSNQNTHIFECDRLPWWTVQPTLSVVHDTALHQPPCSPGHFHVSGMTYCHPLLSCADLNSIILKELIGYGAVKAVYRAEWHGINIAVSIINNEQFTKDFNSGIDILKTLSPTKFVIQFLGFCGKGVIFTEYHQLGNALNLSHLLAARKDDNIVLRLTLCLNYAYILNYLHTSTAGTRVFCDSNNLQQLLSQLLITDAFNLLLNDVDALPEVHKNNNYSIKCGHKEISDTFAAPEQRWAFEHSFVDDEMPGYDEKTDIWKAAAVCEHFVHSNEGNDVAQYYLFSLHKSCRNIDPKKRPSAGTLIAQYLQIVNELSKNDQ